LKKQKNDFDMHKQSHPLASISPGTKCRLVGIRQEFHHFHKHRRGHHRRHLDSFANGHNLTHSHRGRGFGIITRLLDLGLTKGCVFEVVQASSKGPVLIEIRGTRIALGHGLANKILVEEVPS
jgi:ferrous iron transport protein A